MSGGGFDTPAVSLTVLRVVIIGWSSFAVAAVATLFFFAAFDPLVLAESATFPMQLSRPAGYTLGFLAFWFLTASASVISLFLVRSLELHPQRRDSQ